MNDQPTPENLVPDYAEAIGVIDALRRERDDYHRKACEIADERDKEKAAHEFTATAYKLMREDRDQLREKLRLAYEDAERWRFFATSKQTLLMLGGDIRPDSSLSESAVKTTCDALADAHRERIKGKNP